ncbi:DUF1992 domain-containing protein [Histidinibacterium lentulum]|uniref:DUF1992 domain-containing protein n=1 Tax=Histidinibacterium lentulum TaxID=2480588 RepID=A0A3N2R7V5_9RHOB|nr:DUF1992 domain-containing protein [Histidinibacterium lentulum]ROU03498.1 DUF1992 domain-containing protein [Histidinibacterium lentulum]
MSTALARIAQRLIDAFQEEGKLDHLKGAGQPLPARSTNPNLDAATEIGHRVMAENGAVPPEVAMRKALSEARAAFKAAGTDDEKRAAMGRIADLELRINMAAEFRMRRR